MAQHLTLQQTDINAPCGIMAACSGATMLGSAINESMLFGGTPGIEEAQISMPTGNVHRGFAVFESEAIGRQTWEAGTWTIPINITTAQNDTVLRAIYVCRINSACTSVATIASQTGLAIALGGGGIITRTLTSAEHTRVGGENDRIYIVLVGSNTHTMATRTIGIIPDQVIETSIHAPEDPVTPVDADANVEGTAEILAEILKSSNIASSLEAISEADVSAMLTALASTNIQGASEVTAELESLSTVDLEGALAGNAEAISSSTKIVFSQTSIEGTTQVIAEVDLIRGGFEVEVIGPNHVRLSNFPYTEDDWQIERNGVIVATTTTDPYDDTSAPAGEVTYRVRGRWWE